MTTYVRGGCVCMCLCGLCDGVYKWCVLTAQGEIWVGAETYDSGIEWVKAFKEAGTV